MHIKFIYKIKGVCSNKQDGYKSLITSLQILLDLRAREAEIKGDLELVIRQLNKEYKCIKENLMLYFIKANQLLKQFEPVLIN